MTSRRSASRWPTWRTSPLVRREHPTLQKLRPPPHCGHTAGSVGSPSLLARNPETDDRRTRRQRHCGCSLSSSSAESFSDRLVGRTPVLFYTHGGCWRNACPVDLDRLLKSRVLCSSSSCRGPHARLLAARRAPYLGGCWDMRTYENISDARAQARWITPSRRWATSTKSRGFRPCFSSTRARRPPTRAAARCAARRTAARPRPHGRLPARPPRALTPLACPASPFHVGMQPALRPSLRSVRLLVLRPDPAPLPRAFAAAAGKGDGDRAVQAGQEEQEDQEVRGGEPSPPSVKKTSNYQCATYRQHRTGTGAGESKNAEPVSLARATTESSRS